MYSSLSNNYDKQEGQVDTNDQEFGQECSISYKRSSLIALCTISLKVNPFTTKYISHVYFHVDLLFYSLMHSKIIHILLTIPSSFADEDVLFFYKEE